VCKSAGAVKGEKPSAVCGDPENLGAAICRCGAKGRWCVVEQTAGCAGVVCRGRNLV